MELRSDIAAAATRMTSGYEVHREIRQLSAYLREGETVHRLASGVYGAGAGLLAVTSHRVLLLRDGRSGQASEGFPLERLSVVEWVPDGPVGAITISDSNSTAVLRDVPAAEGAEVVGYIRMLTEAGGSGPRRWPLAGVPGRGGVTSTGAVAATGPVAVTGSMATSGIPATSELAGATTALPTTSTGLPTTGATQGPAMASTVAGTVPGLAATSAVPTQGGPAAPATSTNTGSVGGARHAAEAVGYPSQYAPNTPVDELTRGAVPISVLARTSAIPAQHVAVEHSDPRLTPTQHPPTVPSGTVPSAAVLSGTVPTETEQPGTDPALAEHPGVEASGPVGGAEMIAGEVPVSQLAAEATAVPAERPAATEGAQPDHKAPEPKESADDSAQANGRERRKPISWTLPARVGRGSTSTSAPPSGNNHPPVRVEATSKPSDSSPGRARASRARKWVWLGAGAAGLIGLAALGSAKLISTGQHAAAPVSPAPAAVNSAVGPVVTVTRVINGDTVEVSGQYNGIVEVLGILAPRPDKNQCGASAAMAFATRTLNNATVTLVSDPSQPATDRGNRLAFLRLANGADYSVLAVEAGMARYYAGQTPVSTAADLKAAEARAQQQHAGLWGAPCYGKFTSGSAANANATTASSTSGSRSPG